MGFISFIVGLFTKKEVKENVEKKREIVIPVKEVASVSTEVKKKPSKPKTEQKSEEKLTVKDIKSKVKKTQEEVKSKKINASPAAIKLAKENGIDLNNVTGTGKEGSITKTDVANIIK
jgi:pyruvate/2-oxoglutarate dehydrogenase complex dihydrolipoamide acyltransferase (E2) component